MRNYLVSGFFTYGGGAVRPMAGTATLEDDEVMDLGTAIRVEQILLAENNRTGTIATSMRITSFQPYEAVPPGEPAFSDKQRAQLARAEQHDTVLAQLRHLKELLVKVGHPVEHGVIPSVMSLLNSQVAMNEAVQLNECAVILPPVDSPILVEIAPGVLLRALRPVHAENRGDQLLFNLQNGGQFIGRPRWTHP